MTLFEAVSANKELVYIDDSDQGREYPFSQLPLFSLAKTETRPLAFLYPDNSINSIIAFWSFMRSNAALALLSPGMTETYKQQLEALYTPTYIYDPTRSAVGSLDTVAYSDTLSIYKSKEAQTYTIHEKVKLLLNTSGTTGSPKFVKLSEENILSNARSIADYLPINASDVTPLNLPVYYSYGLSVLTTNSIKGGKIVCSNLDVLNKTFWEKMKEYGYTSLAGVPFVYEMLERIGFRKNDYPSLRYLSVAGGRLEQPIMEKFAQYAAERNIAFYVMYGQTEATARMSYVPADKLLDKIGSIGIAIKDGRFELDKDTGELCYAGPNVFGGYVTDPADLASYEQPALLHTGDLARVDDEGYYYITGRVKRIIKLMGTRVNLDEIEAIVAAHSGKAVKCIGVNDKILVIAVTDEDIDASLLLNQLAAVTKLHPAFMKVHYLKEYPLSQNGKVDYNKIAELYGAQ
jgi:long-chain acyl-CoA synthetase